MEREIIERHLRSSKSYAILVEHLVSYLDTLNVRAKSVDVGLLESLAIKTIIDELSSILEGV